LKRLLALALALWHAVALGQPKSDWELEQERRDWRERELRLPPYPKADGLLEFYVSASAEFRFFVDRASISVGDDGVVRYTLVARSSAGAENVSYEGIRCREGTYRVYAYGIKSASGWSQRESAWRPIEQKNQHRHHHALWREYFCPHRVPIADAADGLDALARGGHPHRRGEMPELR
jgi:hypothetical protein